MILSFKGMKSDQSRWLLKCVKYAALDSSRHFHIRMTNRNVAQFPSHNSSLSFVLHLVHFKKCCPFINIMKYAHLQWRETAVKDSPTRKILTSIKL